MTFRDDESDDFEPPRAPKPWEISPSENVARQNAQSLVDAGGVRRAGRDASAADDASPGAADKPRPVPSPRPDVPGGDPDGVPWDRSSGMAAMVLARQIRPPRKLDRDTTSDGRSRWAAAALSAGCFPAAILSALMEHCGITEGTARNDITRSRRFLAESLAPSLAVLRLESLAFYSNLAADNAVDAKIRLQARKRIDDLYGLDSPKRVAVEIGQTDNATDQAMRQEAVEAALESMSLDDLEALSELHRRLSVIDADQSADESASDPG